MLIGQFDLGSLSVEINFQGVKLTQLKLIRTGFFNVSRKSLSFICLSLLLYIIDLLEYLMC